jgi:large subunit ribosomal protein L1
MSFEQSVEEAVEESKNRNFSESIELIVNVRGVDLSDPENRISEDLRLPNKPDEEVRIAVIGDTMAAEVENADEELTENELEEYFDNPSDAKELADDFSFLLAEAPLMPKIGQQLGQVLGPRNMMPDPVQPGEDPTEDIEGLRNTVSVRLREHPLVQIKVGEEQFDLENVSENAQTAYQFIENNLPEGRPNIKSVYVKTTMGQPVQVEV